jgi:8-oxo-dGTP pyrophosphatase MutT (NUDIX family)
VSVPANRRVSRKSCRPAAQAPSRWHKLGGAKRKKIKKGTGGALFCVETCRENILTKQHFDPQIIPIEALAGEAPVQAEHLAPGWLRARFANPPPWLPEAMAEHVRKKGIANPTPAAVLLPIVLHETGPTLLLTQRTAHLTDHGGQISLPGGRTEASDASPVDTALRETEEEIGLDRRHVEVIGTLPDYFTGTGFRVTPVVALVHPPFELSGDPFEVAEIFEVPLTFLMDGANHQRRSGRFPDGIRTFYAMPYERFFIWGATAGMLRNLFHFLRA